MYSVGFGSNSGCGDADNFSPVSAAGKASSVASVALAGSAAGKDSSVASVALADSVAAGVTSV